MKVRRGIAFYASLAHSLRSKPGTAADVCERFGVQCVAARRSTRALLDMGVLSVAGWEPPRGPGTAVRIFGVGAFDAPSAPPTRSGRPSRHVSARSRARAVPEAIAFGTLWDALHEPRSTLDLVEETGIHYNTIRRSIAHMQAIGMVGIAEYRHPHRHGPWTPCYALYPKRIATPPAARSGADTARAYRERQARLPIWTGMARQLMTSATRPAQGAA